MADVTISHPDKQLWARAGITKADLAEFYETVADRLLDHLRGRPVTLQHHPRGVDEPGFLRKDLPDHAPEVVGRWTTYAPSARRDVTYAVIDDPDALRWCAGQNVTEFHTCLFRTDTPERLDTLVVDLDPGDDSVPASTAARWVKEVLDELGVESGVKTSGGRGLHVVIRIERRYDVDVLRDFVNGIAAECARRHPDELTTEFSKVERGGRLFLDCTRVGIGATLIAAWSPRARPEATVSTPLRWDEVDDDLDVTAYTQQTVRARSDPLADLAPRRIDGPIDEVAEWTDRPRKQEGTP